MQTFSSLGFSCIRLQALVLGLLLIGYGGQHAAARETYVQYAARILAEPADGTQIRPELEAAVLRATNAYLASKGLKPLKAANETLLTAARAQAMDLLMQGGMGHVSSHGHDFQSRMRAFHPGQMFLSPMAENAARLRNTELSDSAKAQALVRQWITSPGHRKNMTSRTYVSLAIGVASRGKDVYAVQVFSGPAVKSNMMTGQGQN